MIRIPDIPAAPPIPAEGVPGVPDALVDVWNVIAACPALDGALALLAALCAVVVAVRPAPGADAPAWRHALRRIAEAISRRSTRK